MIRYRASWVLPIAGPPIRDGWVAVESGRIASIGRGSVASSAGARAVDLGAVAIMPGLVNAHTHLELSYLRGQVPQADAFVDWIRDVIAARRTRPDAHAVEIVSATAAAISEAVASGTALVGDISNTLVSVAPIEQSPLAGVVFCELIAFNPPDADRVVGEARDRLDGFAPSDRVRLSLAAHAPYSVAPAVFRAIQRDLARNPAARCSVHLSESVEEEEFIRTGGGPWRAMLDALGSWNPDWQAPAVSPVQFLDDLGFLDNRVLAVHGVQMTPEDLARLKRRRVTLVCCPRSNRRTGAGTPPIARFYASGVDVALGTDSLASTPDLNLFTELAAMRSLAPEVPASALLESATRRGADALGFGADYGTIEPGKLARLLAIDLRDGGGDVEEYLVSGIQPAQLRWLQT